MRRLRHTRPWQAVTTRPHLPIVVYLAIVGWAAVASADRGSHGVIPGWLALIWAVAVGVGGVLAASGCLLRGYRSEQAGHALLAFGAGLYAAVFGIVKWPDAGPVLIGAAVIWMCLVRIRVLRQSRKAREVATIIKRGG